MSEVGTGGPMHPGVDGPRGIPLVSWEQYKHHHKELRTRAIALAQAEEPGEIFRSWRFRDDPELLEVAQASLAQTTPRPGLQDLRTALTPTEQLVDPAEKQPRTERQHRQHVRRTSRVELEEDLARVWSIAELDWAGREIEVRERIAWRVEAYRPSPADFEIAQSWTAWMSGMPWEVREAWERHLLPAAVRSFRAVCLARSLPDPVIGRVVQDLNDAFFYRLLGGGQGTAGWVELAARTLETRLPGPVIGLAEVLDAAAWNKVARCAVTRGHWRHTVRALYPELPEPLSRVRSLERRITAGELEPLLDLHVVSRLLRAWGQGSAKTWPVVTQNRGRARGRLRALLAGAHPDTWFQALLDLEGLHARTLAATRRWAWSWAWQELARDFAFDLDSGQSAPCDLPEGPDVALDPAVVRTWVLLVVLRGRLRHLQRWVRTGGTGDRDSSWARLLSDELPPALTDPVEKGRAATYHRLRAELAESLDPHLEALRPTLDAISATGGRNLAGAVRGQLGPLWHEAVRRPTRGFPTMVRNVGDAVVALESEDPCGP